MHGRPIGLALPLLLAFSAGTFASEVTPSQRRVVEAAQQRPEEKKGAHLTPDGRIRDLLNHPTFGGFGRLLLPWDNRSL